jgi:hypothetical protein
VFSDDDLVGQLLRVLGVFGLEKEKKWKRLKKNDFILFGVSCSKPETLQC